MLIKRYRIENSIDIIQLGVHKASTRDLQQSKYLIGEDPSGKEISRVDVTAWDKEKIFDYIREKNNIINDQRILNLLNTQD